MEQQQHRAPGWWKKIAPKVAACPVGRKGSPFFPTDYEIMKSDILQWTDVRNNHNKYYSLELHVGSADNQKHYRLYTQYGRTDDLENNPDAGRRETRPYKNLLQAEAAYEMIYDEKTTKKGYKKVDMASSNIGSEKARAKASSSSTVNVSITQEISTLSPVLQEFVHYIYSEATSTLTATVSAKITARGIETPLGVLTLGQVQKGEALLDRMIASHASGSYTSSLAKELSSEFYTIIPHKIGRSKSDVLSAVITTPAMFQQKQELLQLMKDMINVNESGGVLFGSALDNKYKALKNSISVLDKNGSEFKRISNVVLSSQVKTHDIEIVNIFSLYRENEHTVFKNNISDHKLLYHGSRISNWVGLLSRGILMPKAVVSLGGKRTDYGLLGAGIYFGGTSCTSAQYCTPGAKGTRFLMLANVALGTVCELYKITPGLVEADDGFQSVRGVARRHGTASDFEDDEYVIYDSSQQHQQYLVEFRSTLKDTSPSGWSFNPLPVGETTGDQSVQIDESDKKKSSFTSFQTARISTGGKAPYKHYSKEDEDEEDDERGFSGFTFQTARKSTGGKAPRKLFSKEEEEEEDERGNKKPSFSAITIQTARKSTGGKAPRKQRPKAKTLAGTFGSSESDEDENDKIIRPSFSSTKQTARISTGGKAPRKQLAHTLSKSYSDEDNSDKTKDDDEDLPEHLKPYSTVTKQTGRISTGGVAPKKFAAFKPASDDQHSQTAPFGSQNFSGIDQQFLQPLSPSSPSSSSSSSPPGTTSGNIYTNYADMISPDQLTLKNEEDKIREIFATSPTSPDLDDPYLLLTNVYSNPGQFIYSEEDSIERSIPKILAQYRPSLSSLIGSPCIVPHDKWIRNWNDYTSNQFIGLDWSNIFVAGGSVMSTMDLNYPNVIMGTDIDLFLVGIHNEEQANQKLKHIFDIVQKNRGGKGDIIRTKNAITILGSYPCRHIQIILRLYKSPAEVLIGFDIDSCTVGFDGSHVWALGRAVRAMKKKYNLVDLSRRSLTYEIRLNKYAKRGFAVAVPGLKKDKIDSSIYKKNLKAVRGLAKLLIMDYKAARAEKTGGTPLKLLPKKTRRTSRKQKGGVEDGAQESGKPEESDYSEVALPWGPEWESPQGILSVLTRQDKAQFFSQIREKKKNKQKGQSGSGKATHLFVSGIEGVLHDTTRMGPLVWVKENPGRQLLTGSFHPVTDEFWDTDAYRKGGQRTVTSFVSTFTSSQNTTPSWPIFGGGSLDNSHQFNAFNQHVVAAPAPTVQTTIVKEEEHYSEELEESSESEDDVAVDEPKQHADNVFSTVTRVPLQFNQNGSPAQQVSNKYGIPIDSGNGGLVVIPNTPSAFNLPSSDNIRSVVYPSPATHLQVSPSIAPYGIPPSSPIRPAINNSYGIPTASPSVHLTSRYDIPPGSPIRRDIRVSYDIPPMSPVDDAPDKYGIPVLQPRPTLTSSAVSALFTVEGTAHSKNVDAEVAKNVNEVFGRGKAPKSAMAKMLLLVSMLWKAKKLSDEQKKTLKKLILEGDEQVAAALEVFEVEHDFTELEDTLQRILYLK